MLFLIMSEIIFRVYLTHRNGHLQKNKNKNVNWISASEQVFYTLTQPEFLMSNLYRVVQSAKEIGSTGELVPF